LPDSAHRGGEGAGIGVAVRVAKRLVEELLNNSPPSIGNGLPSTINWVVFFRVSRRGMTGLLD